jgi:hypothetical protein
MPNILRHNPLLDLSPFAGDEWGYPNPRGIITEGGQIIQAQVVVSEDHSDDLIITEHPIQAGAFINDHAFKRPAEVQVQMGWSTAFTFDQMFGTIIEIYSQILELQASRLPFTIYTGKRVYYNMLVASLRTHTDQRLEYSFLADISFREIVLVHTSIITAAQVIGAASALADPTMAPTIATGRLWALAANIPTQHVPWSLQEAAPPPVVG